MTPLETLRALAETDPIVALEQGDGPACFFCGAEWSQARAQFGDGAGVVHAAFCTWRQAAAIVADALAHGIPIAAQPEAADPLSHIENHCGYFDNGCDTEHEHRRNCRRCLLDRIGVLEGAACGYQFTGPETRTAHVRHTICRYCSQSIVGWADSGAWRDQRNSTACPHPGGGHTHAPIPCADCGGRLCQACDPDAHGHPAGR